MGVPQRAGAEGAGCAAAPLVHRGPAVLLSAPPPTGVSRGLLLGEGSPASGRRHLEMASLFLMTEQAAVAFISTRGGIPPGACCSQLEG